MRQIFRKGWIAVLILPVIYELYAVFDGNDSTEALTSIITSFIPSWIFWTVYASFSVWLIQHFYLHYGKKKRRK